MQGAILIAGVGNMFHGDDAFGTEVARRLAGSPLPSAVRVVDFGIRGHDLAFALQDGYDAVILVDVVKRGQTPGTLCVMEPDAMQDATPEGIDTHAMHPMRVLQMLKAQGRQLPRVWLVGCEPASFGPDEGHVGLSAPVAAAVAEAVALISSLVTRVRS